MSFPQAAFREFMETMPVPAYLFNGRTRRFVAANTQYCDLVGYTEQELTILPWPQIMADDGQVQFAHHAMRSQTADASVQWRHRKKNGSTITFFISHQPVTLIDGNNVEEEVLFAVIVACDDRPALSARQAFAG